MVAAPLGPAALSPGQAGTADDSGEPRTRTDGPVPGRAVAAGAFVSGRSCERSRR
jgi:hypothetical protein